MEQFGMNEQFTDKGVPAVKEDWFVILSIITVTFIIFLIHKLNSYHISI